MAQIRKEAVQQMLGGMTMALDKRLMRTGEYYKGLNVSARGGLLYTRDRWLDLGLSEYEGLFQGSAWYSLEDAERFVFAVAGHVYSHNFTTGITTDHGKLLSTTAYPFYFEKVDRYFVVQDGDKSDSWANAKWPVILYKDSLYDNSVDASGAPLADEQRVPKGGPMAYGHGRLHVATDYIYEAGVWYDRGRVGFVSGDIIKAWRPEDVLSFTESIYLNEGGRIVLPQELKFIHAMTFQQNVMSGFGQGPLIVIAEKGSGAFQVNAPRRTWPDMDMGVVLFRDHGTVSYRSVIHNNSDIIYRSDDAIRSLARTTQNSQGSDFANPSISEEVNPIMELDDRSSRLLTSAAYVDDRIFMTAVPGDDNTFSSLVVMDTIPTGSLRQAFPAIYDGLYTGLDYYQVLSGMVDGKETLIACSRSATGKLQFFKLSDGSLTDYLENSPPCRVYTDSKAFENVFDVKRFLYVELWASKIEGDVTVTCYYRSDGYPLWGQTASALIKAGSGSLPQNVSALRLAVEHEDVTANQVSKIRIDAGYALEFCIEWTGIMQLDMARFFANVEEDDSYTPACDAPADSVVVAEITGQVELNDYDYRIN